MLDSVQNQPKVGSNRAVGHSGSQPGPAAGLPKIRFPDLDLDALFRAAHQNGFLFCDLYCELNIKTKFSSQDRIDVTRVEVTPGAVLRCHDGSKVQVIKSNSPSTSALIEALKFPTAALSAAPPKYFENQIDLIDARISADEKFTLLSQIARQLWSEPLPVGIPWFGYEDSRRFFLLADSEDRFATGYEESASATAKWNTRSERKLFNHSLERHRLSITGLLADLQKPMLFKSRIEGSLSDCERWPAPKAALPVLWSHTAFAKLNLSFLRAFEGDLFLAGNSFLTKSASLPFHYGIDEVSSLNDLPFDHEGSARKTMSVLQNGKPRGLACNRNLAEQLAVAPTGHSRRDSFRSAGTVGFRTARLNPLNCVDNPLNLLEHGLSVHDLEVIFYSSRSGEIELKLNEAYLVHNGEEGERIEPVIMRTNLPQLLQSCHQFSLQAETIGFKIQKQGQEYITEIQSPSALSLPIDIDGTVPAQNYW